VGWEELWYGADKTLDKQIPVFYRMNKKGCGKVIKGK
jgi:hypothetical protein